MKKLSIILITFLAGFSACESPTTLPQADKMMVKAASFERPKPPAKMAYQDTQKNEEKFITVLGYIDVPPENKAAISPYFGGFVSAIMVIPGQTVKQGETLITLQNPEYLKLQQAYLETREKLEYLQQDLERQRQLSIEQIASSKTYKKAELDFKVMQAQFQSLSGQIKLMGINMEKLDRGEMASEIEILAPYSGSITQLHVNFRQFIEAKEVAVEMVNTDHIHLELELFEKDVQKVKAGQKILFQVPEYDQQEYEAQVQLVGQSVNPEKRTIMVHAHVKSATPFNLIPGLFVKAKIFYE